ncbi:DUF3102 domain-containing protein [Streptococcus mitis]|uniref:DUF3102 domain-containing protein n=1 Tax=Streptococcus mitis TaxID=28037 RepID=UPI001BE3CFD1|nr:DUF3102 domain-containing protein [Streptococcus mitis]MBT2174489.1 DUF3102 domain-containing protein [Streptococcus mitis]MBT2174561.1 DUF3102 domain-containing protein [Streptococcus mitis]
MNEITLSNNLNQIELEINHHKQIAGQSIWEIGRRLNHVKEHDLTHGQFMEWLKKVDLNRSEANRMMKVAKELPNYPTLGNLGSTALYLIAALPAEEKQAQINRIEQGDNPTVRELQDLKLKFSAAKRKIMELEKGQEPTKEIVKEVPVMPADYQEALQNRQKLEERAESAEERNAFLEAQLKDLYAQRAEVDEKSNKYDELTKAIQQSQGQLDDYQKRIASYKNILSLIQKGNDFLANMGGLIYADEEKVLHTDGVAGQEFDSFVNRGIRFFTDLQAIRNKDNQILEGEIL